MIRDRDGSLRAIGDPHHNIPGRLRRVVLQRDGHRCCFPGCHRRYLVDVHHCDPWPHGATEADNLVTVCRFHHNLIHVFSWKVRLLANGLTEWRRPNGDVYDPKPVRAGPTTMAV